MDINKIMKKIYDGTDEKKQREIDHLYMIMADYIKENNPSKYEEYAEKAEAILYRMSLEDAEKIVNDMYPYGQNWSYSTIESYLSEKGIHSKVLDYYLTMNMMYNDYKRTAQKYDLDNPDFYFDMAHDFIEDEDAEPNKVAKYFMD